MGNLFFHKRLVIDKREKKMFGMEYFIKNFLLKEENKMYAQSPFTLINVFVHRLLCETKIPRSVIPQ